MIVFKLLIGVAVFWLWFFIGSRNQCPNCGVSLEDEWMPDGPLSHTTLRDYCSCGWRHSDHRAQ